MGADTPPAGNGSGEAEKKIQRIACRPCGAVLEFTGTRPRFCSSCGSPLAVASDESTVAPATVPAEAPTLTQSQVPELIGKNPREVGGYRLQRRLGSGGMGSVFEAEDAGGRRVAIKLIAAGQELSADAVERFRREGRLASAISHSRCVFVLAADEDAGRPYIVMELMPGATLADLLRERGPLPPGEAVEKILDVLDGLREAHRLGVVHRDVKPSNCFLEADGRVKVGDFGLSKSLTGDVRLTGTGAFLGTPLFSSPEQVRGEPLGPQSDIYSLSATLYCLLVGRAPFEGGDAAATLARIASDPAPPLRTLRPELSSALERVVLRGLERDRHRRWRDLEAFRRALLPFLPGRQDAAGPGARVSAILIDFLIVCGLAYVLFAVVYPAVIRGLTVSGPDTISWQAPIITLAETAFWLLYFAIPERRWGATPGKWLLRLRVCTKTGFDAPGPGRALLRAASFYVLFLSGSLSFRLLRAVLSVSVSDEFAVLVAVLSAPLAEFLGIGLLLSTVRSHNGWRGLHEFLSGTRVVRLPGAERRQTRVSLPFSLDAELAQPRGLPAQIGPFTIRGALRWGEADRVLLGEDRALKRPALLWLRESDGAAPGPARHACDRPARSRWLVSGTQDGWQWDAFLAPAGRPLTNLVATEGALSWPEARSLLTELSEELVAATDDRTLPDYLAVDQVWLQPGGGVLLLDVTLRPREERAPAGDEAPQQAALSLLRQVAVLALEGWPRPGAQRVHAAVPEHAALLFGRLFGQRKPFRDVEQFRAALEATRTQLAEVTRIRQATRVAMLTAVLTLSLCSCPANLALGPMASTSALTLTDLSQTQRQGRQALQRLETTVAGDLAAGVVNPQPLVRAAAVYRLGTDLELCQGLQQVLDHGDRNFQVRLEAADWVNRIWFQSLDQTLDQQKAENAPGSSPPAPSRKDVRLEAADAIYHCQLQMSGRASIDVFSGFEQMLFLTVWVLLWAGSAAIFRGGVSYTLTGLTLVLADGRQAGRLRCAVRALLAWGPPAALFAMAALLDSWQWASGAPRIEILRAATGLRLASFALLVPYPFLAVTFPRRGPLDRLTGTCVVPR